jgi:hypothetical protein
MLTDTLLSVASLYCSASGIQPKTVSSRVFDDSKVLPLLLSGGMTITLKRADSALEWFSANWPADADWPDGVPRPVACESAPVPHEAA